MVTCQVVWIDARRQRMRLASAGHPPAMLLDRDSGTVRQVSAAGPPLGVVHGATWATTERELGQDELVVVYTDGLIERRGEDIDEGLARLRAALAGWRSMAPDELASALVSELAPEQGYGDDVAVLACALSAVDPDLLDLELDARPRSLVVLRRALRRWLAANDLQALSAYDVLLAVNESVANAIEHAYGLGGGRIQVRAERDDDALRFSVRDTGNWRPPRGDHRGRGLAMMRRLMTDVDVVTDDDGTQVTLVHQLEKSRAHA
jgi:anti-sigma regulatory factor (Ser/Thr protein kinase)